MKDKELLERMSQNSEEHNITCLIEEMSELTQALCKHQRGRDNMDNIAEEMHDVMMMLQVTQKCLKVPPELIYQWQEKKESNLRDWFFNQNKGEQYEDDRGER